MKDIEELKDKMSEMFGISKEELGDPFDGNRTQRLPKPVKYWCDKHQRWWYPDNDICCPDCKNDSLQK